MTETAALYGPVMADIPLVGERLSALSAGKHPLLGEALRYVFDTSGKRMRPALVLLAGRLGEYPVDRLVTLAASLEVVHTATLVHDDTIDQALTRRGLETINAVFDSKVAILVGDFLFAQSAELAAQLDSVRIMTLLSETVMAMSAGELQQYASSRERVIDVEDYLTRIAGKTASLFAMCCEGGAIVSGQDVARAAALRAYGRNLGLAFQIADDVLDFAGDESSLGKPVGSDLRQGTITLPAILFYRSLSADDPLRQAIEEGTQLDTVITAIRASEALAEARGEAERYAAAARSALDIFPPGEAREALWNLPDFVIQRHS